MATTWYGSTPGDYVIDSTGKPRGGAPVPVYVDSGLTTPATGLVSETGVAVGGTPVSSTGGFLRFGDPTGGTGTLYCARGDGSFLELRPHTPIQGLTAAQWTSQNPVLPVRIEGIETDTLRRKVGDGATAWTSLPYAAVVPADAIVTYTPNQYPTDVSTRSGRYDPRNSVYNLSATSLRSVAAAMSKALAGIGYFDILCIGDSTTWGYAGTTPDPSVISTAAQLAGLLLRAGLPDGGTGWVFTNDQGDNPDSRWTFSTGWGSPGPGLNFMQTVTSGSTATFSSDHTGTIVEFGYYDNSAAFTYGVDGATPITITPTGTSTVKTVTLTGLADTTHSLVITTTTTSTTHVLCARVRQVAGLAVTNAGIPGSTTADWAPSAAFYKPFPVVTAGLGSVTTYGVTFVSLGLNETSTNPASFQLNLQSIASAAPGSVVLWVPPTPSTAQVPALTWQAFRDAYYNVADALNIPLIDVGDAQGPYTVSTGNGLRFDSFHPNAAGYAHIAALFASLLLPFGIQSGDRKWTAASLVNGWVEFGNGFSQVSFRKDTDGYVHIRGMAANGTVTAGTAIFTLPAGYRPGGNIAKGIISADAFGEVRLSSTGVISAQVVNAAWVSFDGITFLAEN